VYRGRVEVVALAAALLVFASAAPAHAAAPFEVGAATVSINPGYPVYMGGYGGGPNGGTIARHVDPLTGQAENFTVRAIAIVAGGRVVELERIDSQGYYAGYMEGPYGETDVREAAAAYLRAHGISNAGEADIIVSALHEHASPSIQGIWGPPSHALPYLKQVAAAGIAALEQAFEHRRPATITWGSADAPWLDSTNIANANANEGWPNDGSLLALWARDASTGETIATYVSEPAYPNIVYGPNDLKCPNGVSAAELSTDFPSYLQNYLQSRLGGMALVASGTLGDQPGPLQGDSAASRDLPPVTVDGKQCKQTVGFDDAVHMGVVLGNLVTEALASGHPVNQPVVGGAEQYILSPIYNPLLLALNNVAPLDNGSPWTELGNPEAYPTDRSTSPPYEVGSLLGTWVTGLRIGGILILSEPGEFFPSVHQAWDQAIRGAAGVFVVGMGQDQLGYDFPAYAYPFTYYSADQNYFNPSLTLGDQVVTAGEQDAQTLGFQAALTTTAEQTALNNEYARAAQPGVQLLPFPQSGDIDPATGGFATVLEGFATPPRFNETTPCNPPVLPNPPTCPTGPPPTIGPIHWNFGDGTTYVGGNGAADETSYFNHSFCAPGRYLVSIKATDSSGNSDSFALPVTVNPPLRVTIIRDGGQLEAAFGGGDGNALVTDWTAGGRTWFSPSIPLPGSGVVRLTVVDGTGTTAVAQGTVRGGRLHGVHQLAASGSPFAAGQSTGASCTPLRSPGPTACALPSGRLKGLHLGPVVLGMTRTRARRSFLRFATRGRRYMDFYCLATGGIRAGYPSPRLLSSLSAAERRRIQGRVVLALTANRFYALRGVTTHTRLAAVARRLRVSGPYHIGLNYWYLVPNGPSRGLLKVRHGAIEEIGIVDKELTRTHRLAMFFLKSFS
jgi:PKD domain